VDLFIELRDSVGLTMADMAAAERGSNGGRDYQTVTYIAQALAALEHLADRAGVRAAAAKQDARDISAEDLDAVVAARKLNAEYVRDLFRKYRAKEVKP
jgi:hypothetical protein